MSVGAKIGVQADAVVLENAYLRVKFFKEKQGYGLQHFYSRDENGYVRMAVAKSFSKLVAGDASKAQSIFASSYEVLKDDGQEAKLHFKAETVDSEKGNWSFLFTYALNRDSKRVEVEYEASVDRETKVYLFAGPTLYVGEGSFGSKKDYALFPGLEYLKGDEESSSTKEFTLDWSYRMVPHPNKITIPLMAISYKNHVIALLWDAMFKWDGRMYGMAAKFSSPNRKIAKAGWNEMGNNHVMGLFVPSFPDKIKQTMPYNWNPEWENVEQAAEPYILKPETRLKMKAWIYVDYPSSVLKAIDAWIETFGLPEPAPLPRSYGDEIALCRETYLDQLWDKETRNWRNLGTVISPHKVSLLLWTDSLLTRDRAIRERLRKRVEEASDKISWKDLKGLTEGLWWTKTPPGTEKLAFYRGNVATALKGYKERVEELLKKQNTDGSWKYELLRMADIVYEWGNLCKDRPPLGVDGMDSVYHCCASARWVLRYARITGDKRAQEAGLRCLEYMRKADMTIPQGAWTECPAYSPYQYSAALAVEAYLEAYALTNDERYIEEARYWAYAGLQFVYLWNLPDAWLQRYASIPIYGSSYFHIVNWIGNPVSWINLCYAYSLQHFARYDNTLPWKKIAEGIIRCIMHWQYAEGTYKGLYPDAISGIGGFKAWPEPHVPGIEPSLLLVNVFTLLEEDPDVETVILMRKSGNVHINSAAKISNVQEEGSNDLALTLKYFQGETCYSMLAGVNKPRVVLKDSMELNYSESLDGAAEGWYFDDETMFLYVKTKFDSESVKLRLLEAL